MMVLLPLLLAALSSTCVPASPLGSSSARPVPAQEQSGQGFIVAEGFLLEDALPGLAFGAETTLIDLAFDADGVPYVLLQGQGDPEPFGSSLLRVTDPGGGGRTATAEVILRLPLAYAGGLTPWIGERLLIDRLGQEGLVEVDARTLDSRTVAFAGPRFMYVHRALPGGDLLANAFGELWRVSPLAEDLPPDEAERATAALADPRQVVLKIGPPRVVGRSFPTSAMLRSIAVRWDGELVALEEAGQFVDALRPGARHGQVIMGNIDGDVPLSARLSTSFLLFPESAPWRREVGQRATPLLVVEPGARRVALVAVREEGSGLELSPGRVVVEAGEGAVFGPTVLRLGPDGHVWIVDPTNARVWRLRPAESSTALGPVLRSADGAELLRALRSDNPERRAMAQSLILERGIAVHAQDRGMALLDAIQTGVEPYAAACIDAIFAVRGQPLPRSEPVLDAGGPRERLERHQVRLDAIRSEPLAVRRLLPRWLECTERTRLLLAQTLAAHEGATEEEQRLAAAALTLPESTTRVVGLFDPPGTLSFGEDCEPGDAFLSHLAPLGVEYVEALDSIDQLLPRLASAHTLVLASLLTEYSPLWRELIDAHLARGGGVVMLTYLTNFGEAREPRSDEPRAEELRWLRGLASFRPLPGLMCGNQDEARVVSDLPGLDVITEPFPFFNAWVKSPLLANGEGNPRVHVTTTLGKPIIVTREPGGGRVVTYGMPIGCAGTAEPRHELLLRTFVEWAGELRAAQDHR